MQDQHHILKKSLFKKRGEVPEWLHSPINLVEIEHYFHINEVHSAPGNIKGEHARKEVYHFVCDRLNAFIENENWDIRVEEAIIVKQVYYWCLIQNGHKQFKDPELLKVYERVCKKVSKQGE